MPSRTHIRAASTPPGNEHGFLDSCEVNKEDRVYRTLHALERLSGVVSALTRRVDSLEAAASTPENVALSWSLANLEFPTRARSPRPQPPDLAKADLVKEVKISLTQDPSFQETLLGILEASPSRKEVALNCAVGGEEGKMADDGLAREVSKKMSYTSTSGSQATKARAELQRERARDCGGDSDFHYRRSDYSQAQNTWMAQAQMYSFGESAWDAAMFAFNDMISKGDSIFLVIMFIANALTQFGLVILVWTPFTTPNLTSESVNLASTWRTSIAHDSRWADRVTSHSLARLVCSYDLPYMSSSQRSVLDRLLRYAPREDWGEFEFWESSYTGELVCALCLVLWWSTLYVELRDVLDCMLGLCFLPMKDHTIVMLFKPGDVDDIALRSMTLLRKLWCFLVLFLRALVSLMLLYIGSQFLVYTLHVGDLFVNALALGFLLQLDELMFDAMSPLTVRHFMSCLRPIPKDSGVFYRRCGFDKNIIQYFVFIPVCFSGVFPIFLHQNRLIEKTRVALCGGNLDFIFSKDPGGAIVAHPSFSEPQDRPRPIGPRGDEVLLGVTEYQTRAVQELVDDLNAVSMSPWDSLSDTAPALYGSALGLQERPSIPLGERMSQLNPFCADISERAMVWPNKFVRNIVGNHPVINSALLSGSESCSASTSLKYCNWDNEVGSVMRRWCSRACGCHQANSSLIVSKDYSGCPKICTSQQPYIDSLAEAKCEDHAASSQAFQDYLFGLSSVRESYKKISAWDTMFEGWIDQLSKNGCSAHVLLDGGGNVFGDLCAENAFGLKPLQWLCPVTCKCGSATTRPGSGQAPLCPTSCSSP